MAREKLGDYRIVREIGRGGMGAVYEANSPAGERVAVKTILTSGDLDSRMRWEMVERFMTEARAIRALDHKNIVSVTDVGQDEGEFFMVMEFLDGQSVRQLLDMVGAIPIARATKIVSDVCSALTYAHQGGVIHRDIKPDNIVILKSGVTKLTDFGLARIGEIGTHTQTGTMMGTFAYMSPEQARGEKLDARSDLFSLGVTFYEMVAGERPFRGEGSAAVLQAILMEEPLPLSNASEPVQLAVARCLAKDPAARFPTAAEFQEALAGPEEGTVVGRPAISIPAAAPPSVSPATGIPGAIPAPASQLGTSPSAGAGSAATPPATPPSAPQRPKWQVDLPPGWLDAPSEEERVRAMHTPTPSRIGNAPKAANPDKVNCPCGEQIGYGDASCWKCGRPNAVVRARTERQQEQSKIQEIQKLAAQLDPQKKKPWWKLK